MGFFNRVGSLVKQTVSKRVNSELSVPGSSLCRAIRSMSSSKLFTKDGGFGGVSGVGGSKQYSTGGGEVGGVSGDGGISGSNQYTSLGGGFCSEKRKLYTVLRSPHIDKKSREQFEMKIKKQYFVVKTDTNSLRKKFFWLKRHHIFGAQVEVLISCKTRLPKRVGGFGGVSGDGGVGGIKQYSTGGGGGSGFDGADDFPSRGSSGFGGGDSV